MSFVKVLRREIGGRQTGIRFRIILSVASVGLVMSLIFLLITQYNRRALIKIGGSYETNAYLSKISTSLIQTEKALDLYIRYRTFESIDSYYSYQNTTRDLVHSFPDKTSADLIFQKEYIVRSLSDSFLELSQNAVMAQRAMNEDESQKYYGKSKECFAFLQKQIESLNILLMEANAENYKANQGAYSNFTRMSIVVLMIFFILMFLILYFSLTIITRPLTDISNVALRVSNMDFDVPLFNSRQSGEIGNICRAFDRMIVSIQEYINKIWEKAAAENELKQRELRMRELYADAQLRALQNQINPHFLFNTLNTGAQLAMIEGSDKVCYFLEQVADFFRYNIRQDSNDTTVSDELGLVDNFVYIMKVRFGDRFDFEKKVPQKIFSQRLPRMTLQPLVENCIKHGLDKEKGRVLLEITEDGGSVAESSGRAESGSCGAEGGGENGRSGVGQVLIKISDNGQGFSPAMREKVLNLQSVDSKNGEVGKAGLPSGDSLGESGTTLPTTPAIPATGTGTGLINVISRLRLYFHRDDVFDILTNEDGGATFVIRIPKNV